MAAWERDYQEDLKTKLNVLHTNSISENAHLNMGVVLNT